MQQVKRRRTAIKICVKSTAYKQGEGAVTTWVPITVPIGTDESTGETLFTSLFYCEWLNSYGATALQQQSDGVIRPARVRMTYVKSIYDALISKDVKIYLDGIIDEDHAFMLASAADNYLNDDKMIEFQVKKYEVK